MKKKKKKKLEQLDFILLLGLINALIIGPAIYGLAQISKATYTPQILNIPIILHS